MNAAVRCFALILTCVACVACSTTPPTYRARLNTTSEACIIKGGDVSRCVEQTPELWRDDTTKDQFRIHFVEFDDQGWLHDKAKEQIDSLMNDLKSILTGKERNKVSLVLFVHGWKHNADGPDRDVHRFRQLLSQIAAQEATSDQEPRQVVGIYVGWRGRSWEHGTHLPDFLLNFTFWTRKAAAIRVAQGQVRELFARLKTLQDHWNGGNEDACRKDPSNTRRCAIRSLMVGHSLGAWIIYAAVSQSIVEVLAAEKDLETRSALGEVDTPKAAETRRRQLARLGDLVLLVNPAFEGVRYEVVHKAQRATRDSYDPPVLVLVQSTVDVANKAAFPLGRFINALFEKETSAQKPAMRATAGHVEHYVTHDLRKVDDPVCAGWEETQTFTDKKELRLKKEFAEDRAGFIAQTRKNFRAEDKLARQFFGEHTLHGAAAPVLSSGWSRPFCGGLRLTRRSAPGTATSPANIDPNSLVWNVRTDAPTADGKMPGENVIHTHSDFMTPSFLNFVRQLYRDVGRPN